MTADSGMVITFLEVLAGHFTVATPTGQRAPSEKLGVSYIHGRTVNEMSYYVHRTDRGFHFIFSLSA